MKTILVPTDFSKEAAHALRFAMEMASQTDASIVLLHIFYQPLSFRMGSDYAAAVHAVEKEKAIALEAYANKIRLAYLRNFSIRFRSTSNAAATASQALQATPGLGYHHLEVEEAPVKKANVSIRCVARYGFAIDEILKASEVQRADLVVMGMRGAGAITQAFLGSTTLAVIQKACIPVLAVPAAKTAFKSLKSVVLTLDINKVPRTETLQPLYTIARLYDAKLHVLHLYQGSLQQLEQAAVQQAMQVLDATFRDLDYEVHFKEQGKVAAGIKEFVAQVKADLLVLVPRQHTFLDWLLQKSITGKMASEAFVPVLALPYHPVQEAMAVAAEEAV